MEKVIIKVKPLLRGHSHQAMFFVSLGACSMLLTHSTSSKSLIGLCVYSFGVLLMFGISALYHRIHWEVKERALMKKLDHAGIYIMIAGTCTPVALSVLSDESGQSLLLGIWIVALIGVMQSIFFVHLPKIVSALIYLIPGYMIIPYMAELKTKLGSFNISLLLIGGVFYTVGALCYGLRKPVLFPRVFGYHEVFHALVCLGAIVHFILIYRFI